MFGYDLHHQLVSDRRARFELDGRRHRLRRRHRAAAEGGATPTVVLRSVPLGRTPSGIDRQAA